MVVCERRGRDKVYDVPRRALPDVATTPAPSEGFGRWGVLERVHAAGLPDIRRTWLGPPDLLDRAFEPPDDRMRILGPSTR